MKQIPLPIATEPARTFDSFVVGANAAALAQLLRVGPQSPPLYLWGPAGSGKTHLLQALSRRAQGEGTRVAWFDADSPAPWPQDDDFALIAIDDCERLDVLQQQAAFGLFVQAAGHGAAIVAAGRLPPVDLPLREDLRSRLGWGHVFGLQPLAEPETRAVLRREADRRGLFLSDEVMDYLLTRFERDLKHLVAQLDRLDRFALVHKRAITLPLLRQMLAEGEAS
jgi:DnaA family protein